VAFDAEHPRVRLVFLIGTPKEAAADYLKLVASLSRRLKSAATRKALLAALTEGEFLALLARSAEVKR
jgi:mannitol/fructose-specific phosphotransferase system IIA component (Ntr-type)